MNLWKKDKKSSMDTTNISSQKQKRKKNNRAYWNQILPSIKRKRIKATKKRNRKFQYLLVLKKLNPIDYKNGSLLRAFLTKYGKIRPRRKTKISIQAQHGIAKAIRKARAFSIFPFTRDVKLKI
jgi:small subunit ribosomal protein S18